MKKKILLSLFVIALIMPVGYASFVAFYPPAMVEDRVIKEDKKAEFRRKFNYRPWSGARSETDMQRYSDETKNQFDRTNDAFEQTARQYDGAIKAADDSAQNFDNLAMNSF